MYVYNINRIPFCMGDFMSQFQFQLPENNALSGLCEGMVEAWNLQNKKNAAILFIIEEVTYNICDQVRILVVPHDEAMQSTHF